MGLTQPVRLPLLDGLFGEFPLLESFEDPVEIVVFGLEFSDRVGRVRGDEFLFSGFVDDADLKVPVGALRHVVFELIHDLQIFVGQFKDAAPDLLAGRGRDAGKAATPLGRPSAEFDRMVRQSGQV